MSTPGGSAGATAPHAANQNEAELQKLLTEQAATRRRFQELQASNDDRHQAEMQRLQTALQSQQEAAEELRKLLQSQNAQTREQAKAQEEQQEERKNREVQEGGDPQVKKREAGSVRGTESDAPGPDTPGRTSGGVAHQGPPSGLGPAAAAFDSASFSDPPLGPAAQALRGVGSLARHGSTDLPGEGVAPESKGWRKEFSASVGRSISSIGGFISGNKKMVAGGSAAGVGVAGLAAVVLVGFGAAAIPVAAGLALAAPVLVAGGVAAKGLWDAREPMMNNFGSAKNLVVSGVKSGFGSIKKSFSRSAGAPEGEAVDTVPGIGGNSLGSPRSAMTNQGEYDLLDIDAGQRGIEASRASQRQASKVVVDGAATGPSWLSPEKPISVGSGTPERAYGVQAGLQRLERAKDGFGRPDNSGRKESYSPVGVSGVPDQAIAAAHTGAGAGMRHGGTGS